MPGDTADPYWTKKKVEESIEDLDQLDFNQPIYMYSQTTKSPKTYSEIKREIEKRRINLGID